MRKGTDSNPKSFVKIYLYSLCVLCVSAVSYKNYFSQINLERYIFFALILCEDKLITINII